MRAELEKLKALYDENIEKYGMTSRCVGWNTVECQNLRFEKLLSIIDRSKIFSINELGCGYSALIDHMSNNGYHFQAIQE